MHLKNRVVVSSRPTITTGLALALAASITLGATLGIGCSKAGGDEQLSAADINAAVADTATGQAITPHASSIPNIDDATPKGGDWLDKPLHSWNVAGATIPSAPNPQEPGVYASGGRCATVLPILADTGKHSAVIRTSMRRMYDSAFVASAIGAVARAGWTIVSAPNSFHDIVTLTAAVDADGMCRPFKYQTFVFSRGVYAGTLSPHTMDARTDGALSGVRLHRDQQLIVSFNRYKADDALCCPSQRSVVHYRVQRDGGHPVVVPADTKTTSNRASSAKRKT